MEEVSAEMYLELLYPGLEKEWTAVDRGVFSRNYSRDIIGMDLQEKRVELSRDGFLKYLPPEMISPEDELSKTDFDGRLIRRDLRARSAEIRNRLKLLSEAFAPFDTFSLRLNLDMECRIEELLSLKVAYVLKEFFGFDIENEKNEYVRQAAAILPFVSTIRGKVGFVRYLLETIVGHEVVMETGFHSVRDQTVCHLRYVRFDVIIDGLDENSYLDWSRRIAPLESFVREHMMPLNVVNCIKVKGNHTGRPLLDYNSHLV